MQKTPKIKLVNFGDILVEENNEIVYNSIKKDVESGVVIDFDSVKTMTTCFSEKVFGKLYLELGSVKYFEKIIFENTDEYLNMLVRIGIENAINNESVGNNAL